MTHEKRFWFSNRQLNETHTTEVKQMKFNLFVVMFVHEFIVIDN